MVDADRTRSIAKASALIHLRAIARTQVIMPGATTPEPRVTVIDDNTEMLTTMSEILRAAGYRVTTMSGEHATMARVATTEPDLVILDLVLGRDGHRLNGWEYLSLIRSHDTLRSVPVLVCSGDIDQLRTRRDELSAHPDTSVLEKPFTLDELESAVTRLVEA